jgi:hypothetical protein
LAELGEERAVAGDLGGVKIPAAKLDEEDLSFKAEGGRDGDEFGDSRELGGDVATGKGGAEGGRVGKDGVEGLGVVDGVRSDVAERSFEEVGWRIGEEPA